MSFYYAFRSTWNQWASPTDVWRLSTVSDAQFSPLIGTQSIIMWLDLLCHSLDILEPWQQ